MKEVWVLVYPRRAGRGVCYNYGGMFAIIMKAHEVLRVSLKKTYGEGKENEMVSVFIVMQCRKHWALRPQKPSKLLRDGEAGGSGNLYLTPTRYTVTTRMILH